MNSTKFRSIEVGKIGELNFTLETEDVVGSSSYDDGRGASMAVESRVSISVRGVHLSAYSIEDLLEKLHRAGVSLFETAKVDPAGAAKLLNYLGVNRRLVTNSDLFRSMSADLGHPIEQLFPNLTGKTLVWHTLNPIEDRDPVQRFEVTLDDGE